MINCDVLIIGGGVIGTAVAARLSQTEATVCLVEKADDVADGASKGNVGITSSYYSAPGTLEAKLISASVFRWDDVCRRLNVPFRRIGALVPALNQVEFQGLSPQCDEARACGVGAEILSREETLEREPMISPSCLGALYLPDEGIIDPMRLTYAFAELAAHNGADIQFNRPVIGFEISDSRIITAITPGGVIKTRYVVNCAGLHADVISALAGGDGFRMWPRKGQFWVLDREFGARLNHIVFAAPAADTKGIHVAPTTRGSVLLGPTVEDGEDRYDKSTSKNMLAHAFAGASKLVPEISLDFVIKSYAALRPASETPFFLRFDGRVPNLIHAVSRSIGVSTSLGIADHVLDMLKTDGLQAAESKGAITALPATPIFRHTNDPSSIDQQDEAFRQIVCVCEQVTAAEINAALTAKIPARSIEGVWKRTGATGGRCQGTMCLMGVTFMCATHMNRPPEAVPVKGGTEVGIGRASV